MAAAKHDDHPDCPVRRGLALFEGKWRTRVLYELILRAPQRFGELARDIPNISNTMLSSTLRDLEEMGLVIRTQYEEVPLRVEYALSESGRAVEPLFDAIGAWGQKYLNPDSAGEGRAIAKTGTLD